MTSFNFRNLVVTAALGASLLLSGCGNSNPVEGLSQEFNTYVTEQFTKDSAAKAILKEMKSSAEGTDTLVLEINLAENPVVTAAGEQLGAGLAQKMNETFLPKLKEKMASVGVKDGKLRVIVKNHEGKELANELYK